MHISHKPTHKHGITSSRFCGSTQNKTACAFCTRTEGSHVKCMKHATKLARKYEPSPTYFSTLSHVLEKERTAGPFRQRPFFSFPVVVGVQTGGLGFAVFWKEVTVLLNLKHLKYLRPPSLFRIKGIALSSAPVAVHKGSWDHVCLEWVKHCRSHYVIY